MASMRRGDWAERLRKCLYAQAEAKGWPKVTYRPRYFTSVDSVTAKRMRVVLSGLLSGSGTEESLVVIVGPGRESWEDYLPQALYHDLMSAASALPHGATATMERTRPHALALGDGPQSFN